MFVSVDVYMITSGKNIIKFENLSLQCFAYAEAAYDAFLKDQQYNLYFVVMLVSPLAWDVTSWCLFAPGIDFPVSQSP